MLVQRDDVTNNVQVGHVVDRVRFKDVECALETLKQFLQQ